MSKNTFILIALVLLAVMAGLYVLNRGEPQKPDLVFPELQTGLNEVTSFSLSKDSVMVTVEKSETTWTVAQNLSYPADVSKLRTYLQKLAKTKRLERKTAKPELYSKLGVEDVTGESPGGLLVTLNAPEKTYDLIVGKLAPSGSSFTRIPDDAASWLVDQDLTADEGPVEWLDRDIVDLSADRIQAVIVETDGKVLATSKENRAQTNFSVGNVPAGRELRSEGVANSLSTALKGLQLDDVQKQGSDDPQFLAKFLCFDGLVVTVRGYEIDTTKWIQVSAGLDVDQATKYFPDPMQTADQDVDEQESVEKPEPDLGIVQKEVDLINQTTSGWRYSVPDYKYDQINKQLEDMLSPKE